MERLSPMEMKSETARRLEAATYPPRRLALIHTGIALLGSLVLTIISYFLNQQVASTGGLSGIGMRSVLQSAQSVLSLALTVAMPFWEFGFVMAAMRYARQQPVRPWDLANGFRKIGPILRLILLQILLYTIMLTMAFQLASTVVLLTPLGNGMVELIETLAENNDFMQTGVIPEDMLVPLLRAAIPECIAGGVLFALAAIPLSYRLRLARYMVLDGQDRAMAAFLLSNRIMKGNCLAFFKLDVSFWWFWALQVLCGLLAYGDALLPMVGVQLPISADTALLLFYGLQLAASLVVAWRWRAPVETAYALAYDTLTAKTDE